MGVECGFSGCGFGYGGSSIVGLGMRFGMVTILSSMLAVWGFSDDGFGHGGNGVVVEKLDFAEFNGVA
ncbi:hypothetical protein ACLOJK_003828 [Asimina triloba]